MFPNRRNQTKTYSSLIDQRQFSWPLSWSPTCYDALLMIKKALCDATNFTHNCSCLLNEAFKRSINHVFGTFQQNFPHIYPDWKFMLKFLSLIDNCIGSLYLEWYFAWVSPRFFLHLSLVLSLFRSYLCILLFTSISAKVFWDFNLSNADTNMQANY